ncbi:MAG: hypothetical protein JXN59_14640 [Anaerolineae bacterium]|nr:hypothetical protein [Anaerolineae bacterium]
MRLPRFLTVLAALVALAVMLGIGSLALQPPLPLINGAGFDDERITPNADGENDLTTFRYSLTRNATVTLAFADQAGNAFVFRDAQPRVPDDYSVLFSGIVEGYTLPGEDIAGEIETRLLPEGEYTWTLLAEADDGETMQAEGMLILSEVDSGLPEISGFTLSPDTFSPNQDGIDDRVTIYTYLEKDANLTMYLLNEEGDRQYITEVRGTINYGEAGLHEFDYDGGIDAGEDPPSDGDYTVVVLAEDAAGQRVRRTAGLAIEDGGHPLGAIYPQSAGTTVFFDAQPYDDAYFTDASQQGARIDIPEGIESTIADSVVVVQGDMLVFRLVVTNDGPVGLRTSGPPPGTVYQQDQRSSGIGWYDQSGAWRIGLECDTVKSSYPWRWAIGTPDVLEVVEQGGETYYYLPPGARAEVWGGVRMTDIVEQRNPQPCWIGLIHEDVEVVQANVERRWVEIQPGPEPLAD